MLAVAASGQKRMNEKRVIKEKHIDFTTEVIYFELHGMIEIDGHVFMNDTCKCPIIYYANLDGVTLIDTCRNVKYSHRTCDKPGCKIIHLVEIQPVLTDPVYYQPWRFEPAQDYIFY